MVERLLAQVLNIQLLHVFVACRLYSSCLGCMLLHRVSPQLLPAWTTESGDVSTSALSLVFKLVSVLYIWPVPPPEMHAYCFFSALQGTNETLWRVLNMYALLSYVQLSVLQWQQSRT
jgi:hypothetical protein